MPHDIAIHRELPKGQTLGAIFWHEGEKYYVTQQELNRVQALPSAEDIRKQIAAIRGLLSNTQ